MTPDILRDRPAQRAASHPQGGRGRRWPDPPPSRDGRSGKPCDRSPSPLGDPASLGDQLGRRKPGRARIRRPPCACAAYSARPGDGSPPRKPFLAAGNVVCTFLDSYVRMWMLDLTSDETDDVIGMNFDLVISRRHIQCKQSDESLLVSFRNHND